MEKEVTITQGVVTLTEPLAGKRNESLAKAETPQGIKWTVFLMDLIPHMITKHPFGAQPLKQALDSLTCKDYDALINAATEMLQPAESGDVAKKSEKPSEEEMSQQLGGSGKSS